MTRKSSRRKRRTGLLVAFLVVSAGAGGTLAWLAFRESRRAERIASLQKTRDKLRARLLALSGKDAVLASAPDAEVVVGVPQALATEVLGHVAARLVHGVQIVLRDVEVHKAGEVHTKSFVKTPGRYRIDFRIDQVTGVLEPGAPKLEFRGDRVGIALPVRIARGEGRATLRFAWDSRGIAGLACGDFRAQIPVSGRVAPRTYPVRGTFALELVDGALVATPSFPDLEVNIQVEPSADTWKEVDRVLSERPFQCRAALKLVNVPDLLRRRLERGFNVKVPPRVFKPFRLPAVLRREVTIAGRTHVVLTTPRELALTPKVVWLGADMKGETRPASPRQNRVGPTDNHALPDPRPRRPRPRGVGPCPGANGIWASRPSPGRPGSVGWGRPRPRAHRGPARPRGGRHSRGRDRGQQHGGDRRRHLRHGKERS